METIDNSGGRTYIDMEGIVIPDVLRSLAIRLEDRGFEAYAVGGCVRDMLLGREPCDFDLITNADFKGLKEIFPEAVVLSKRLSVVHLADIEESVKFKKEKRGDAEGELQEDHDDGALQKEVHDDGASQKEGKETISADIATYRSEKSYRDGRPYEFSFVNNVEEDLPRRDFTINALALKPVPLAASASLTEVSGRNGNGSEALFIDMFGGVDDLRRRTIRSIGVAEARFKEDPLRMLRAIRIAAQLNFELDEEISKAIASNSRIFGSVNGEKAGLELVKLLTAEHAGMGLGLLLERGVIHMLLGGAGAKKLSVMERLRLKKLCKYIDECKRDEGARLSLFFSCFKKKRTADAYEKLKIRITCKTQRKKSD